MFTSTITIEGRLAQAPQVFDNLTELVVLTNRRTQDTESGEWSNSDTTRYVAKTFKTLATRARDLELGDKVIVAGSIVTRPGPTRPPRSPATSRSCSPTPSVAASRPSTGEGPQASSPRPLSRSPLQAG
jgi:single-stranded DNA-binding protein